MDTHGVFLARVHNIYLYIYYELLLLVIQFNASANVVQSSSCMLLHQHHIAVISEHIENVVK